MQGDSFMLCVCALLIAGIFAALALFIASMIDDIEQNDRPHKKQGL